MADPCEIQVSGIMLRKSDDDTPELDDDDTPKADDE